MRIVTFCGFILFALVALTFASCGGGGGGGVTVGGGGGTPVTYRVLDLATGSVSTVTNITLTDAQYTTTKMVFRQIPAGTYTRGAPAGALGTQADEVQIVGVSVPAFWIVCAVSKKLPSPTPVIG